MTNPPSNHTNGGPEQRPEPSSAASVLPDVRARIGRRTPVFFLDFDGTLAPLTATPELACLAPSARSLLARLARINVVCLLSGRSLPDLRAKVGLDTVYYGGDHGRCIVGPPGTGIEFTSSRASEADLQAAAADLRSTLAHIPGVLVESKDLSLAVHYRLTPPSQWETVATAVGEIARVHPSLTLGAGKLVHELRPNDGWGKGQALLWLLGALGLSTERVCPICLGDDLTDEDMFCAVRDTGVAILVGDEQTISHAHFRVDSVEEVHRLLLALSV